MPCKPLLLLISIFSAEVCASPSHPVSVPEPESISLILIGLALMALIVLRKK